MVDPEVALEVHAREELGVDPDETGNPVAAAVSSFVAFTIGALVPLFPWFFAEGNGADHRVGSPRIVAAGTVGVILAQVHRTLVDPHGRADRSAGRSPRARSTWLIGSWLGAVV